MLCYLRIADARCYWRFVERPAACSCRILWSAMISFFMTLESKFIWRTQHAKVHAGKSSVQQHSLNRFLDWPVRSSSNIRCIAACIDQPAALRLRLSHAKRSLTAHWLFCGLRGWMSMLNCIRRNKVTGKHPQHNAEKISYSKTIGLSPLYFSSWPIESQYRERIKAHWSFNFCCCCCLEWSRTVLTDHRKSLSRFQLAFPSEVATAWFDDFQLVIDKYSNFLGSIRCFPYGSNWVYTTS